MCCDILMNHILPNLSIQTELGYFTHLYATCIHLICQMDLSLSMPDILEGFRREGLAHGPRRLVPGHLSGIHGCAFGGAAAWIKETLDVSCSLPCEVPSKIERERDSISNTGPLSTRRRHDLCETLTPILSKFGVDAQLLAAPHSWAPVRQEVRTLGPRCH